MYRPSLPTLLGTGSTTWAALYLSRSGRPGLSRRQTQELPRNLVARMPKMPKLRKATAYITWISLNSTSFGTVMRITPSATFAVVLATSMEQGSLNVRDTCSMTTRARGVVLRRPEPDHLLPRRGIQIPRAHFGRDRRQASRALGRSGSRVPRRRAERREPRNFILVVKRDLQRVPATVDAHLVPCIALSEAHVSRTALRCVRSSAFTGASTTTSMTFPSSIMSTRILVFVTGEGCAEVTRETQALGGVTGKSHAFAARRVKALTSPTAAR
eukprot:scaffold388_cov244-Pinguiococcus_pyrenoidosus.AAC.3